MADNIYPGRFPGLEPFEPAAQLLNSITVAVIVLHPTIEHAGSPIEPEAQGDS